MSQHVQPTNLKIGKGALVSVESKTIGDITIGDGCVVHPKAEIIAESGPIIIAENNIIEEQCRIINKFTTPLMIGANNVFEVDCHFEGKRMGDHNIIEAKAYVGPNVELSNGCIIGAACRIFRPELLPENIVIFGENCDRRIAVEKPPAQTLQMDILRKVLPNYHHFWKARSSSDVPQ